ncbi:hypothetical protein NXS98_10070 [Fontisphaera persica]|uniref:Minf_1886 family protein n=1 Tax=Fontisphaera persica TaxID=2974023 RepID=UPI0024C08340|nr:Minf_1886 family protein [Fontisphaera persica]WCJ58072.1 hypothetical protein NXS98_10070 [Fontisphaera persica]
MHKVNFDEELEKILERDPRYDREAYHFVREALEHTQKMLKSRGRGRSDTRHVTGQQLLDGIRDLALKQFGPMTITVFEEWGIHRCEDFGEIVFNMVEQGLLSKTKEDSRADFQGGYDFDTAFRQPFLPSSKLSPPREPKVG